MFLYMLQTYDIMYLYIYILLKLINLHFLIYRYIQLKNELTILNIYLYTSFANYHDIYIYIL